MKKLISALFLITLVFSFSTAQKKIKQVQVTSKAMAKQPAGKSYAMDLTRGGTVYNLDAGVDYSRVRVRTSKGEMALSDLLKGSKQSGRLMVGRVADLRNLKLGLGTKGGTVAKYTCQGLKCQCTGDADCNDMFSAGVCGDIASCDNGAGTCECLKL